MPIQLEEKATEGSTLAITVRFYDETGALVVPTAANWTLLDAQAAVVNARDAVAITPLASSVTIVLHGADLIVGDNGNWRDLVIQSTYDSTLGDDLECNESVHFGIEALPGL